MEKYLEQVFDEVKDIEIMQGRATTPATNHLFKTCASAGKHLTAKLLCVDNRGRPDIKCDISIWCTRVKEPENDDYKKLARVIKYLHGTKFLETNTGSHSPGSKSLFNSWRHAKPHRVIHDILQRNDE